MAERKSGPVKPPVIDLKARPTVESGTAGDKPAAAADAPTEASAALGAAVDERATEGGRTSPAQQPRPQARLAMPWSAISIAVLGGAVLGTALTYGLVNLLPLPDTRPPIEDPALRLDAQDVSLADLDLRLTGVEAQTKRTQISLDATLAQLDAGLAELRATIAALPPASVDLEPLAAQLQSLEARVVAIGAGASSADASALATTLAGLQASQATLQGDLVASQQRIAAQDSLIATLQTDIAAAKTAITTQNQTLGGGDVGPAIRLPLLVGGLESAFANGRPFAAELNALTALLPDLAIPDAVLVASASGLPRPDAVANRLTEIVPDILAGRTATGTGDLGQDTLEWMKAVLALRPAGELEGDTPDAIVSRLEAAIDRRDFVAAAALLEALPPPMLAAAGSTAADIRSLASAETFIAGLRSQALAPATEPAS